MFTLSGLLRTVREHHNLSARGLSLRAGLSDSYVGKVENRTIEPSLRAFLAIMDALEMNDHEKLFFMWVATQEFATIAT